MGPPWQWHRRNYPPTQWHSLKLPGCQSLRFRGGSGARDQERGRGPSVNHTAGEPTDRFPVPDPVTRGSGHRTPRPTVTGVGSEAGGLGLRQIQPLISNPRRILTHKILYVCKNYKILVVWFSLRMLKLEREGTKTVVGHWQSDWNEIINDEEREREDEGGPIKTADRIRQKTWTRELGLT